jgi:dihydropteroate synthase
MQSLTQYENFLQDILFYFSQKMTSLNQLGVNDIIIDPGFGFSKTLSQNYELMSYLSYFKIFEAPILVGISRKSMIYKLLETSANESLNGTSVLNTYSLLNGADILRVHDVKEAVECIKIVSEIKKFEK